MRELRDTVLGFMEGILQFLHDIFVPIFGAHSWGWAIIALTVLVRVLLLPLAIKQTRSMRAMQALQPKMKELQKKYKVDRSLLKKDPEQYKAKRAKLNEELMALYKREGANPAASCLPLLAQAPVFIVLFWTLRGQSRPNEPLFEAPFYFFTQFVTAGEGEPTGLAATVTNAGWPGWLLILLMSGTLFLTQRQMLVRNAAMQAGDNPMAQQQKILMYVMPVFLAVISFQFPLGILLYWVTTNVWQVAQQWVILREVQHEVETGELGSKPGGSAASPKKGSGEATPRRSPGASSGKRPADSDEPPGEKAASDEGVAPPDGRSPKKKGSGKKSGPGAGGDASKASRGSTDPGADGDGGGRGRPRKTRGIDDAGRDNGRRDGPTTDGAQPRDPQKRANDRPRKRDHLPRRRSGPPTS